MSSQEATLILKFERFVVATTVVYYLGLAFAMQPVTAAAQATITATDDHAKIEFPDRITFSVGLQGEAEVKRVVLEYGVEQLTCSAVIAKAFPVFTPSKKVEAEWTWEMRQTGSQPPGSHIWWRWRATDANGSEYATDRQTVTWLDDQHPWQTVSGGLLNLHWYSGGQSFGRELHTSALRSLADLERSTGIKPDSSVDLYIYADTQDMRDVVLYEPGWTGGLAYPEHNIVIIGIAPEQIEWGKRAEAHELTHVLVGHLTFSCLGDVPTWLNEGLAVYGEGGPEAQFNQQFEAALANDSLISVRALSGNFSEDPSAADLSYGESYSLVNFLIEEYGRDKMLALLRALRDGVKLETALHTIYGFDLDGFEDAWRARIGAKPRAAGGTATPTPRPTLVPTIVPVSGAPLPPTLVLMPVATPTPLAVAAAATQADIPTATSTEERNLDRNPSFSFPSGALLLCPALVCWGMMSLTMIVVVARWRRKP